MKNSIKEKDFNLGTTYTIGSYILPGQMREYIDNSTKGDLKVSIKSCTQVVEEIKSGKLDLGLIETPTFHKDVIAQEWLDNELVICSKVKIPNYIEKDELAKFNIICQPNTSPIQKLINKFFTQFNIENKIFNATTQVDNTTATIQSVKWSKPNLKNPTITIVSPLTIEDEVKREELFISRIKNHEMHHKFYIVYHKKNPISTIQNLIDELLKYKLP